MATERRARQADDSGNGTVPLSDQGPEPAAAAVGGDRRPARPFPFDRVFALARPGVAVTAEEPKWAKKGLFVMLMLDEALASVRTHLDERRCC